MSKAIQHARRLRIIALPLTSASPASTSRVYYRFQTPPPPPSSTPPSLLKKVTNKAAELWSGFGKAPEGSWKQRAFQIGERAMDRIEFEELALKSMDPSLGPDLSHWRSRKSESELKKGDYIPLAYPTKLAPFNVMSPVEHLKSLLSKRTPKHKRGFYMWMLVAPLTAPIAIIPLIPNLPFFFCVWRSWHHYRAFKASEYLEKLIEGGAVRPEPSVTLDKIYEKNTPEKSGAADSGDTERVVLDKEAVPRVITLFELPSTASADLLRALEQTHTRINQKSSGTQ